MKTSLEGIPAPEEHRLIAKYNQKFSEPRRRDRFMCRPCEAYKIPLECSYQYCASKRLN